MFNSFDMRMFNEAKKEAEKSDFDKFHFGAVITYKNRIIGRGHNSDKTDTMQCRYNIYRHFNNFDGINYVKHSIHAEISAIKSIPYVTGKEIDFSKCSIYIYRICDGNENGFGNSMPCPACRHALIDMGITNIYYTSQYGYSYTKLSEGKL